MKTINYTGRSKLISRIVHLLNRKAPLPLNGDGDAEWGTSGQVLTTDGQGNTYWGEGGGGGGGDVTDVEVNGTSVVNAQGVAEVSVPTKTSDLNNDSGFVVSSDLASVATSGDYSDLQNKPTIPDELADLTDDSTHRTVTDTQISTWNGKSDFSGSYNDLTDKPTIPTVNDGTLTIQQNGTTLGTFTANQSGNTTVNLTGGGSTYTEGDGIDISNNEISVDTTFTEASTRANIASGDSFSTILGKIKKFFTDLKTVAFTGAYSDLSGTPTIPSVGNGTLTIQKNGTNVQTFTANQSGNATANITVPTNTNELTNGAGFLKSSDIQLSYGTPFYYGNRSNSTLRFTFTNLSVNESIHLLIFGRYGAQFVLLHPTNVGFSNNAEVFRMYGSTMSVTVYTDSFTVDIVVGAWSAVYGMFVHPHYPSSTLTITPL